MVEEFGLEFLREIEVFFFVFFLMFEGEEDDFIFVCNKRWKINEFVICSFFVVEFVNFKDVFYYLYNLFIDKYI